MQTNEGILLTHGPYLLAAYSNRGHIQRLVLPVRRQRKKEWIVEDGMWIKGKVGEGKAPKVSRGRFNEVKEMHCVKTLVMERNHHGPWSIEDEDNIKRTLHSHDRK